MRWLPRAQAAPVLALPSVRKALIGLGTFLALLTIAAVNYIPQRLDLRSGQIAPRDIEATRTVEYIDEGQTAVRRRLAAARVEPAYRLSSEATGAATDTVTRAFDAIARVRATAGLTPRDRRARLRAEAGITLSQEAIFAALSLGQARLEEARAVTVETVDQVMTTGIRAQQMAEVRESLRRTMQMSPLTGRALTLASAVAQAAVRPNLFVDPNQTRELRREAADAVQPVKVRLLRGEIILRRGDRVTPSHMEKLRALGLLGAPIGVSLLLGTDLMVALLLGVTALYLAEYQRDIWRNDRLLVLWSLTVILTVLLARIVIASRWNPSLVPAAVGPMLIAILLSPRLAFFTAGVLSVLIGLFANSDLKLAFIAFIGGTVGVYAIRHINHRTDLVIAGVKAGLATAAAVVAVGLVESQPLYPVIVRDAVFGVANGIFVGVLTIGALPYLENLFGLFTPIKLLELSNPGHPLLRRLQMEAPGTYHHSIIVGNLAEAAAEAVGADRLLVRVGTYYHDVGKLRRPVFFMENQIGVENPHNRMSPSLSALTVAAHVRDGLELAREYKLPKVVADFIPQHHGTTLIQYFYHQAVQRGDQPEASTYRYEGPKPQSREAAIVMLADAVEAAVRSLQRPTPDRIYEVVRRIAHDRLEDGQLDESDMTFRELEKIAQAFTRILTGIFHPRIEYPELEQDVAKQRRGRVARLR